MRKRVIEGSGVVAIAQLPALGTSAGVARALLAGAAVRYGIRYGGGLLALGVITACAPSVEADDGVAAEESGNGSTGHGATDPGSTNDAGGATEATTTGGDPDGDAGSDSGTESETDGVDPTPPTVSDACEAPNAHVVASFAADEGERFDAIALAWTGSTAALAYAESNGERAWTIWLQRLDGAAAVIEDRIELGTATFAMDAVGPLPRPSLSLTWIGPNHLVCWTGAGGGDAIECAAVLEDGSVSPGLSAPGNNPAVATGPAGVGLVYWAGDAFVSRRLDDAGLAGDEPHEVFTVSDPALDIRPVLGATSIGYVAGADILLPRFDASFDELDGAAIVGWTSLPVSLAGSDDVIAAAWGSLDGVQLRILGAEKDDFADPVRIDGLDGGTSAATTAITRGEGSFAAVWSVDASLMYAPIALTGEPRAPPTVAVDLPWRSEALGVTGTASGFVAAATTGVSQQELVVALLPCPVK